jgi:leucyl-tRNA synthetase
VVSPDDMVAQYGADATRMYALFAAPPDRDLDWQEDGVAGVSRFLGRVWRLYYFVRNLKSEYPNHAQTSNQSRKQTEAETKLQRAIHQKIAKITQDFEGRWHFNTSIAAIMSFVNLLYSAYELPIKNGFVAGEDLGVGLVSPQITHDVLRKFALLLAPFAPFLAAELWEMLGEQGAILRAPWPQSDPALAKEDEIEVPVQINGKLVAVIRVAAEADAKTMEAAALADEKVKARTAGKTVAKVIVVPGRAVNLVVK